MTRFGFFNSASERRKKVAEAEAFKQAKARSEAPPADATPASIIEAGRRARRFRAEHSLDSAESRKILSDNNELFEKFVQSWGGPASLLAEAKGAFVERFEYTEYLKTIITPALIERLSGSEDSEIAKTFSTILKGMSAERFASVVQEQLLGLAARNSAEFDRLAEAIETFELIQRDPEYEKADKEAVEISKRYHLNDKMREELLDTENLSLSEEDKLEHFVEHVRKSKGVIGWVHALAERGVAGLDKMKGELEEKVENNVASVGTLDAEYASIEERLRDLRIAADTAREDEGNPVHAQLAEAEEEGKQNRAARAKEARMGEKNKTRLKGLEWIRLLAERMAARESLKKEANSLRKALPAMEQHLAEVEEYINQIGGTLKATVDSDPGIRKGIQKALVEEAKEEEEEPVPRTTGKLSERIKEAKRKAEHIRENLILEVLPKTVALQFEFDQAVLLDKAQGHNTPRKKLKEQFLRNKIEEIQRAYAIRNNKNRKVTDSIGSRRVALLMIDRIIRRKREIR